MIKVPADRRKTVGGYRTESRVSKPHAEVFAGRPSGERADTVETRKGGYHAFDCIGTVVGPAPNREREQELQTGYGEYLILRLRRIGEAPGESACFSVYQSPHVLMVRGEHGKTGLMQHYPC